MESYLPISFLNDFLFCPRSIYFHQLYGGVDPAMYRARAQVAGHAAHRNIENKQYTTATTVLQAIEIYSETYRICGKIDLYDTKSHTLIERKKKIKHVYDGYIFQVYAQYHCLVEMGYRVDAITLHSLDDNKRYPIATPPEDPPMQKKFAQLVSAMQDFDLQKPFTPNANKCNHCIYHALCDLSLADESQSDDSPIY